MKKALMLATALVLISTIFFSAGRAQAAGLITYRGGLFVWGKGVVFVFEADGLRKGDVKNANIFAGSNFHALHCTVNKEEGKVVCVTGGELTQFGGQTGVIYLGGQVFYVTIPYRDLPEQTCGSQVLGANVTFQAGEGDPQTFFLAGSTLQDVKNAADQLVIATEGFFSNPQFSSIECGTPTLPGFLQQ